MEVELGGGGTPKNMGSPLWVIRCSVTYLTTVLFTSFICKHTLPKSTLLDATLGNSRVFSEHIGKTEQNTVGGEIKG